MSSSDIIAAAVRCYLQLPSELVILRFAVMAQCVTMATTEIIQESILLIRAENNLAKSQGAICSDK